MQGCRFEIKISATMNLVALCDRPAHECANCGIPLCETHSLRCSLCGGKTVCIDCWAVHQVACHCDVNATLPCPMHGATYKGYTAEEILPSVY